MDMRKPDAWEFFLFFSRTWYIIQLNLIHARNKRFYQYSDKPILTSDISTNTISTFKYLILSMKFSQYLWVTKSFKRSYD